MSENVQKGWLNTRDGDKFAPITLVENVYTRNNQPYDERVREYIEALQKNSSTSVASLQGQVSKNTTSITTLTESIQNVDKKYDEKLANINADDTNTLFIIDGSENVIAYVDKDGVHSVDMLLNSGESLSDAVADIDKLETSTSALSTDLNMFKTSLSNIKADGETNDTLYITDGSENVIAYIDKEGVHSINFLTDDTIDYLSLVEKVGQNESDIDDLVSKDGVLLSRIETLDNKIIAIENAFGYDEQTDAFYIIDNNNNVIFYANKDGIHSVNLRIEGARDYLNLDQIVTDIQGDIIDLQKADSDLDIRLDKEEATSSTHDTRLNKLEAKTASQGVDYDDTLYIVDSNNNVVAYFDDDGLHAINIHSGASGETQYDLNSSLVGIYTTQDNLQKAIDQEAKDRKSADDVIDIKVTNNQLELAAISEVLGYKETGKVLYFMDKDSNVIAYIDGEGMHVVNVLVGATTGTNKDDNVYNLYEQLTTLIAASKAYETAIGDNAKDIDALIAKDAALDAIDEGLRKDIGVLQKKVENVSTVMDFVGAFAELPAIASYQKGDVCVVGNKEYVHDGSQWVEIGDTSAEAAAISKLQGIVGDPDATNNASTTHEARLDSLDTLTSNHATALNNLSSAIGWQNSDTLYIMDKNDNVIAYFNKDGLTVTNVTVKDADIVKNAKDQMTYLKKGDPFTVTWSIPL